VTIRDVFILRQPDGYYYCTGSFWGVDAYRRDVVLFRSRDRLHWEPLPPVYRHQQLKEDGMVKDLDRFEELVAKDREGKDWRYRIQWGELKVHQIGGAWYIQAQMFAKPGGHFLLKSLTGKIEGPYQAIQQIVGVADLMVDDDGAILFQSGDWIRRFNDLAEFEAAAQSDYQRNRISIKSNSIPNICFSEDCEAGLARIAGKVVNWSTDWTGSYDGIYQYADSYEGPYQGKMRILPYGGNGKFFQDSEGTWWYAYFPNSNDYATRAQNFCRMNMYPLFVGWENDELVIEPKAVRENRAHLEQLGALWHSVRQ
jgi:hypothetical protein